MGLSSAESCDVDGDTHLQNGDRIIMFHCGDYKIPFSCSSNALYSISIDADCVILGALDNTTINYHIAHNVFCIAPHTKVFMKNLIMICEDVDDEAERFRHDKWCVVDDDAQLILEECSIRYNYNGISLSKSAAISASHCTLIGKGESITAMDISKFIQIEHCYFQTSQACIGILSKSIDNNNVSTLKLTSKENVFNSPYYPIVSETPHYINHFPKLYKLTNFNIWNEHRIDEIKSHDDAGLSHHHKMKRKSSHNREICECGKCGKLMYTCETRWYCCVGNCRYYNCNQCFQNEFVINNSE